jgi:hypothetical protein
MFPRQKENIEILEAVCSMRSVPRSYKQDQLTLTPVEAGSNISTAALRVVESEEERTQYLGV